MENFIGMVLSTLEEAGIDTANLTVEEAIEKYNELVINNEEFEEQEEISVQEVAEQVDEPVEEIAEEPIEEVAEEVEQPAEEKPVEEEVVEEAEEEVASEELSDEEFAKVVMENKADIIAFLREKGII